MNAVDDPDFWQRFYRTNETRWDLGGPTPVFTRLAQSGQLTTGKMIVLGAGRGYDARMFAQHGFTVTAVDFADDAIQSMQELNDPQHPVEVVQSDFFWLPSDFNGRYQYVLDYTSFCAIHPSRRGLYADLVTRLLVENGRFITLAYPIGTRSGGPPFTVQPDNIIQLFAQRNFQLTHREMPEDSIPRRKGVEELLMLQKVAAAKK